MSIRGRRRLRRNSSSLTRPTRSSRTRKTAVSTTNTGRTGNTLMSWSRPGRPGVAISLPSSPRAWTAGITSILAVSLRAISLRGSSPTPGSRGPAVPGVQYQVELSLEEAFTGTTRYLEVQDGDRASSPRRLEVKIPPGVDTGSRVRISAGKGHQRDIYVHVTVRPHRRFRRTGADLHTEVEVPLAEAVLGSEVAVPTLKGEVMLTIPQETQVGQTLPARGSGNAPAGPLRRAGRPFTRS